MPSRIQTPTPNIDESLNFYQRLKFTVVSKENPCLVSDGKVLIEINPDRYTRAGIKLYKAEWKNEAEKLVKMCSLMHREDGYLLVDPSGTWVHLVESDEPNLEISTYESSVLGNYAGLSLEVFNIEKALKIYEILGFTVSMGAIEHGWISLQNSKGMGISLMKPFSCPHLFFNPSLTYFNSGKNPEVITKIRELDIPITEEITHFSKDGSVDNIIIRDPGGYGFFIFND